MKRLTLTIFSLLITLHCTWAQQHREKFNPEEFRARLENFISMHAGFTSTEAESFYPIFHKMKEKQRQLQRDIFRLKRAKDNASKTEAECADIVQRIVTLEVEMAEVKKKYYKKLVGIVPASKVYAAMLAEDAFHRQMLQDIRPNSSPRGSRPPHRNMKRGK